MEFRKKIGTKTQGEYEVQDWHIFHLEIPKEIAEILKDIWENESEDYESAFCNGLCGDFDGELYWVNVNDFLKYCNESIGWKDEIDRLTYEKIINFLKDYVGYTIYPQSKNPKDAEEVDHDE